MNEGTEGSFCVWEIVIRPCSMMDSSGCCIPGLSVNGPRCCLTLRGVRKEWERENTFHPHLLTHTIKAVQRDTLTHSTEKVSENVYVRLCKCVHVCVRQCVRTCQRVCVNVRLGVYVCVRESLIEGAREIARRAKVGGRSSQLEVAIECVFF